MCGLHKNCLQTGIKITFPGSTEISFISQFSTDTKALLIIDRCAAHPDNEKLRQGNDRVLLLPKCTWILQPVDMGILHSFKWNYKNKFLH